jgi:prepilin-type N-terminal cleavage/methylation domain-containing protein
MTEPRKYQTRHPHLARALYAAKHECRMTKEDAFTLIELLIVIAIIAVLLGLAFPMFQGVLDRAKKAQAKNDVTQIVTAVNAFYTEYGRYPIDSSITTDAGATYGGSTSSKVLFDELRAKTTSLNTRQIVFISPPEDTTQTRPKGKIGNDGQFHDPWTTAYGITIDANYDNQVPNPYGSGGAGADLIRQGVIAWSLGKDAGLGNKGDKTFTGSDDVISWQ